MSLKVGGLIAFLNEVIKKTVNVYYEKLIRGVWAIIPPQSLLRTNGGILEVKYSYKGESFIVPVRVIRGSVDLDKTPISVRDNDGNDVIDRFNQFYGPFGNFHGVIVTPAMMGFEELNIVCGALETQNEYTFSKNDAINFN